jgi:SAM-dependent methyltransferase
MTAIDYNQWALRYDRTRGVSESVLQPLLTALGLPAARRLLDIGGGTGNYAVALRGEGFRVTHCDRWPGMAGQASAKGLTATVADGTALPFAGGSFDCAIAIKVANHVEDRAAFTREARRILRGGPFVMVHATSETIESNWITHYIPGLSEEQRFEPEHATVRDLEAAGFQVDVGYVRYTDLDDGSAQALKWFPEAFLADEPIMNTSLLARLPEETRIAALEAIRRDHASGRLREVIASFDAANERWGDGTIFVGTLP